MLHGQIVIVLPFFLLFTGKRAPGSTDIPKDKDEKAEGSNKSGMSAGVIAGIVGIVLGVIGFIVVIILIAVKLFKRKRIPKTTARTECIGRGIPPTAPSSIVHSPQPQLYKFPYASEPGTSMQLTGIPPRYESPPPSYGEIQPSAPPYNPQYKQSFRYK